MDIYKKKAKMMMIISGWVGWPTSWCAMVKGSTWNVWGSRLNGSFGGKSTSDQYLYDIAGCGAVKRRSTSIKLGSEYSVFATKILSESKKGLNGRKAKFQKSFILLVQVLERGGYSTQCEQVQLYLGHLYLNAFLTFDISGIVSFETWPLLTLYPWMLLIKFIKFI